MAITIPEKYQDSIELLNGLNPRIVERLYEALSDAPPSFSVEDLERHVQSRNLKELEPETIVPVLGLVVNVYYIWGSFLNHLTREEFIGELVAAAKRIDDSKEWTQLAGNLEMLLTLNKSIGVAAKALDLLSSHEKVFTGSRIITDSRPVFAEDSAENPIAVMTIHSLKIEFAENGKPASVFIAMDSNDVLQLQKTLERAVQKEKFLQRVAERSGIAYLDTSVLES